MARAEGHVAADVPNEHKMMMAATTMASSTRPVGVWP